MENSKNKLTEDLNNYDIAMMTIEEEESIESNNNNNKDYTFAEIENLNRSENKIKDSSLENHLYKINFTENICNKNNKNTKINLNLNTNYFPNMAQANPSINTNDLNNENTNIISDNINISFNENDLNEIYDSKQAKTKILCCELLNFMEVFLHSVLYLRKVYPQEAFQNYIIYNLNLKFITDPAISDYISEFLESLENLLLNNLIKRITINIVEPQSKRILEFFSLNIAINEYCNDLVYSDVCLHLKSLLYKFQIFYANKKELFPELNKSFVLSVETFDSKVFSGTGIKNFDELSNAIEDNFVIEFFEDVPIKLLANIEIVGVLDHVNFNFSISRNFL